MSDPPASTQSDDRESKRRRLIDETFQVGLGTHLFTGFIHRFPKLMGALADMETRVFSDELAAREIDRPIFIAGLARAGSTILLELIAAHPAVATHQYQDYPPLHTPIWWERLLQKIPRQVATATERAHGDGLMVTQQSPEALEEVLWMAHFPDLHARERNQVFDRSASHPEFERRYRDHLRKILLVRERQRYATKENYNVSRLAYLHKLFPDARFIIPIRSPRDHVASLHKQQQLFCAGETLYPRSLEHMRRVGHYEFGLDRRAVQLGEGSDGAKAVENLWASNDEVRGWARYWAQTYEFVAALLQHDQALAQATLLVRYEDLCADPQLRVREILGHCQLAQDDTFIRDFAARIQKPGYYQARFSEEEDLAIRQETDSTAKRFGYKAPARATPAQ